MNRIAFPLTAWSESFNKEPLNTKNATNSSRAGRYKNAIAFVPQSRDQRPCTLMTVLPDIAHISPYAARTH